jgi:dTDP-4-dehydrorhamnose reductase
MPSNRRVLVTGGAGLVGSALLANAPPATDLHATRRRTPVTTVESHRVDLADVAAADELLADLRPDLVIHTAYGRSDGERDIVAATRALAVAARRHGCALLHLSTDVVFDGEHAPYAEGDPPGPVDTYGRQKAQAERDVATAVPDATIVRTSLVARAAPLDHSSRWVAETLRRGEPLRLFADVLRCPIRVDDLAAALWELAALARPDRAGTWHVVGPEALTRYTLGLLIAAHLGLDAADITPSASTEQPEPPPRDLRLSSARADRLLCARPRPVSTLFPPSGASGPVLRSRRLVLEPLAAADGEAVRTHWNDPAVRRFLWDDRPVDALTVTSFLRRSRGDFRRWGYGLWAVRSAGHGELLGVCGLRAVGGDESAELLYSIDPHRWGQGLATEAACAVLDYAFDRLGLTGVVGGVDAANVASTRVLEKLGMRPEREPTVGHHPVARYALSRRPAPAGAGDRTRSSNGEEHDMSQRHPDDVPSGSGKQFAADVSEQADRSQVPRPTPEGSGKQFAEDLVDQPAGEVEEDEQGKGFARDVSADDDEVEDRSPDAPGDSGKGFARGAPDEGGHGR